MSRIASLAFAVWISSFLQTTWGQDSEVAQLEIDTQRAVVFKDGYCLVVKEATGKTNEDGHIVTDDVPDAAVLGSFWAIPQQAELKSMVSGWVDGEETEQVATEAAETIDLIEANLGASCSITIGEDTKMSGKILRVLGPKTPTNVTGIDAEDLFSSLPEVPAGTATATVRRHTSNKFLLRTENGDVMVDASQVRLLTIENMKTNIDRETVRKQRKKQLRFEFEEANAEVKLTIMYFRPGVRWIPTYRVDLAEEQRANQQQTARLTLQGEIVNEAEDLKDVPIDIVVGVPNFRFKNVASPLVLESVLRNALIQVAPNTMAQQRQMFNNYASNSLGGGYGGGAEVPNTPDPAAGQIPTELATKSGNDLFVYSLPKMTLRKGDRASVPILSSDVAYKNVHTWEVTAKHAETIAPAANQSPLRIEENTVWRQIELTNSSDIPWTTGAAMIVDGFQPLAQELLTYTPAGSTVRIPVTVAVDVRGKLRDNEIKRKLDALRFASNSYARVEGKINASIKNHKKEPIHLEYTLHFGGKADSVSNEGDVTTFHFRANDWIRYRGDQAVNNSTSVKWCADIEPGKTFEPSVDYHFFTRH